MNDKSDTGCSPPVASSVGLGKILKVLGKGEQVECCQSEWLHSLFCAALTNKHELSSVLLGGQTALFRTARSPKRHQLQSTSGDNPCFCALESIHECPRHTQPAREDGVEEAGLLETQGGSTDAQREEERTLAQVDRVAWVGLREWRGAKLLRLVLYMFFLFKFRILYLLIHHTIFY